MCFSMNCFGEDCLYDAIVEAGDNVTTCTAGLYTTCFVSYCTARQCSPLRRKFIESPITNQFYRF